MIQNFCYNKTKISFSGQTIITEQQQPATQQQQVIQQVVQQQQSPPPKQQIIQAQPMGEFICLNQ